MSNYTNQKQVAENRTALPVILNSDSWRIFATFCSRNRVSFSEKEGLYENILLVFLFIFIFILIYQTLPAYSEREYDGL